jgi:hypothetical protein
MRQEQLPDVAQCDLCDEDGWVTGDLFDLERGLSSSQMRRD